MMDWDTITAVDLLALFSSLCQGDKVVHKVEIYPSLFGLEKMKEDALYGPPKEIFNPKKEELEKLRRKQRHLKKKEEESSDDNLDQEERYKLAGFENQDAEEQVAFN